MFEVEIVSKIDSNKKINLCDIWRIWNPKTKRFTFRQQHTSEYIQRRFNYFFISKLQQESVNKTDAQAAFCTDQSPLLFCCFAARLAQNENRGKGLWNFNNSLSINSEFVNKIKYHIKSTLETLEKDGITDFQARWEFRKCEINFQ